jgi:hypothetical protein
VEKELPRNVQPDGVPGEVVVSLTISCAIRRSSAAIEAGMFGERDVPVPAAPAETDWMTGAAI